MAVAEESIAMLDVDHHIHLVPVKRVLMLGIEHSALKKEEMKNYEITCILRLLRKGGPTGSKIRSVYPLLQPECLARNL